MPYTLYRRSPRLFTDAVFFDLATPSTHSFSRFSPEGG
jgi:hypothetical protein